MKFFSLIILAALTSAAQAAVIINPDDLPRLIRENNRTSRAAELSVSAAENRTGFLLRSFLPKISASAGYENFKSDNLAKDSRPFGEIEAKVNVFRFGRDSLEERSRRALLEVEKAQKQLTDSQILSVARKLYWKLVAEREIVTVLKEGIKANEARLRAATTRAERGITTTTDKLEFQLSGNELKEEMESVEHESLITAIRLRAILGIAENDVIQTPLEVAHDHDDNLLTPQDRENSPAIKRQSASAITATSLASIAERAWTPSFDVYAGVYNEQERALSKNHDEYAIGIRLSMNFWDGGQSLAEAAAQRKQADAHQALLAQEKENTRAEIRASQEEMKHAHELIHGVEERIQLGAIYLARTLSEYDRGVKNSPDALGALHKLLGYRKRLIEIKLDYQIAKANLLQHLGK